MITHGRYSPANAAKTKKASRRRRAIQPQRQIATASRPAQKMSGVPRYSTAFALAFGVSQSVPSKKYQTGRPSIGQSVQRLMYGCGAANDEFSRHIVSCPCTKPSGRKAVPIRRGPRGVAGGVSGWAWSRFFGEAGSCGVATVCDAAEGDLDGQFVDLLGIVFIEPFGDLGVVRIVWVGQDGEDVVEAGDAAAILGRRIPFAGDVAGIGEAGLALADVGDGEPVLPGIAEVVEVVEGRLARLQHVAQADFARREERRGSPILVRGQSVSLLVDRELPEMVVEPSHRDLDDVVQDLEGDRGRDLELAPDQRIAVAQFDAQRGDLVEAVGTARVGGSFIGGAHAASLADRAFQFHGRSSSSREAG